MRDQYDDENGGPVIEGPPITSKGTLRRGVIVMDTHWMADGKCRNLSPEVFFPSDGVGVELARQICADCPVREPCLEYALYHRIDHGVWGGASERERQRIARRRRLLPAGSLMN
jgi:WhiB family redox-sensing transcriptional regulator